MKNFLSRIDSYHALGFKRLTEEDFSLLHY